MWQKLALTIAAVAPLVACAGSINAGAGAAAPASAVSTQGQSSVFGDAASAYALFSVDGRSLPYARPTRDATIASAAILSGTLSLQPNGLFSMSTTYRETLVQGERVYDGKLTGACAPNDDGYRMYADDEGEAQLSVMGDTAIVRINE